MNSTYTIIDNFDKLDVSWTDDYRMDNIYIADGFLLADSLDKLSIEGSNKNSEAINFIDNSITLPQGDELIVQNYPNRPLSFGRTYAYMPDMLRFVIGNRFYVGANDFLLHYPNHKNKDTFEHYKSFGIYKPIAGPPAWYFDFFDCPNQIDNNSWYFNNEIRFKDYFLPKNYDVIPALKESDFSSYSKVLEQLASQKSIFHRPEVIEAGNPVSAHLYPFFIPKYNNGTNNNGAPGVLGFLKYSTMYPNLEFENGNTTEEQLQAVMPVVKPTLENLLLFEITVAQEIQEGFIDPALPWTWRPWHLYFVTDLPKGSHSKPEDPDLKKLFNIVEMESKYNYYLANAESSAENIISERQMPNLYTYFSYVNDNLQDIFYYDNLINLGQGKNLGEKSKFTVSKYYDTVASSNEAAIAKTNEQGDILALPLNATISPSYRYKNIIIANTDFLKSANAIAKNFPMYNKITLPLVSQKSDFMEIVKANGETKTFISLMANYFSTIRHPRSSIHTFAIHNNKSKLTQANLQIMDITPYFPSYQGNWFWQDVAESFKDFFNDKDNVMFGGVPILDASMEDIEVSKFQNVLSEAETHFSQNKRSFIDIYNGKKCHTEILAYEIVKSKIIGGKKEHIQSIFIPVIEDEVAIPYIDTQVFYNQEYVYEIYTHSLVIGTQYQINYDFEAGADLSDELAGPLINDIFDYGDGPQPRLVRPIKNIQEHFKVIIIRAPYYNTKSLIEDNAQLGETQSQQTALILDKPPLPPDIVFHPYKDNDDKILILLNINSGERYMYAQPVFIEDEEAINKLKKVYPPTSKYPPSYLPFKNDDGAKGEYLIYKMTQKPTNWKDFVNAQVKTISTEDQTGYNDFIAPNVDYYYFARFRDIHGNLSNPTDVFHIRLVKEGGFPPYLITDVYNFDQGIAPTYEKSFKKYVKIGLQDGVRVLEGDKINTATVGYSKLGNNNTAEPKKYKVRITSKKTGKKVDINLEYSNTTNTDFINGLVPVVGELGEGIPAPLK